MRASVLALGLAACLGSFAAGSGSALAEDVVIAQTIEQTKSIDLALVKQLPATEETIAFQTEHGQEQGTYTGGLLWSVLERSGVLAGVDPRARLRRTIVVTGQDGYMAVLALAEIDPEFEGKPVLLAYERDGQPIPGNELRLVVPGDKRGGRSVRDVVRIEVR